MGKKRGRGTQILLQKLNDHSVLLGDYPSASRRALKRILSKRTVADSVTWKDGELTKTEAVTAELVAAVFPEWQGKQALATTECLKHYMITANYLTADNLVTSAGIDFAEQNFIKRHPVVSVILLSSGISFLSSLFLAILSHYFWPGK